MVKDVQYTYGGHFKIYINIKSQCCIPVTNVMLCVNYFAYTPCLQTPYCLIFITLNTFASFPPKNKYPHIHTQTQTRT